VIQNFRKKRLKAFRTSKAQRPTKDFNAQSFQQPGKIFFKLCFEINSLKSLQDIFCVCRCICKSSEKILILLFNFSNSFQMHCHLKSSGNSNVPSPPHHCQFHSHLSPPTSNLLHSTPQTIQPFCLR
jgi:hypothetical protein